MLEGDAIFRYATRLRPDLDGEPLAELFVRHRGPIEAAVGRAVTRIETRGKHTLIHIDCPAAEPAMALHIHLGMNGVWRRHAFGDKRRGGRDQAGAIVAISDVEWRCLHPMRAEILEGVAIGNHRSMARLGPDLLGESVDWDDVLKRARAPRYASWTIADLVLEQSVACGIGTIYRSESLFTARQNPWAPVRAIADEQLLLIYQEARRLLSMNLVPGRGTRTTSPDDRRPASLDLGASTYVYVRECEPCLRCGRAIEMRRHSEAARKTYYCRTCQIEEPRSARKSD